MPMIDVYAAEGTFADKHALARNLAAGGDALGAGAGDPALLGQHRRLHSRSARRCDLQRGRRGDYVRVQVLTPVGVLDREKQLGVVRELTEIVAAAAGDPRLVDRTWVLITESPEGGWGIDGHANTGEDILAAARAALDATGD